MSFCLLSGNIAAVFRASSPTALISLIFAYPAIPFVTISIPPITPRAAAPFAATSLINELHIKFVYL
jgi:hypothetical protein